MQLMLLRIELPTASQTDTSMYAQAHWTDRQVCRHKHACMCASSGWGGHTYRQTQVFRALQVVVGPKALMHPDVEEALPGATYNALTRRAGPLYSIFIRPVSCSLSFSL